MDKRRIVGVLLFSGALVALFGIHLAEFLYPGYSVSGNYISDLGATCIVYQPSAFIFNTSVILLGILILLSSYLLWKEFQSFIIPALFGLSGLGAVGVGLFPETAGFLHVIVSFITFFFGALAAIAARRIVKAPFSYFSVLMGLASLTALVLYGLEIYLGLGPGGMERMIAYPILLWGLGFGGYMMSPRQTT
ncbi:MAG: DUF998 domain-containing protein [Candidatus Methanoperedens sp.]|nr:DUF998 domain-containing protein [Candidatus Methanoperedens sp.]